MTKERPPIAAIAAAAAASSGSSEEKEERKGTTGVGVMCTFFILHVLMVNEK